MKKYNNILITGASSGLGKSLALEYAKKDIILFLTGRNKTRLDEVKKLCEQKKAKVFSKIIDVKNYDDLKNWIEQSDKKHPLDLVIANAGISAGTGGKGEDIEQINNIFKTNIDGVINTITPAAKLMQQRKKGQIAIISSLAGYRGLPSSPAYSASKAAVKIYGEALRGHLCHDNIGVSVVTPGYIITPMTDVNNFPMPFIVKPDIAARKIIKKLEQNASRIAFPFPLYFVVWLMSCLSPSLTDWIFARLPKKPSSN